MKLDTLKINRFKGLRDVEFSFPQKETAIHGANATGKTSVMDAFTWLLFGKDSKGRADFEIKTLDKDGKTDPQVEYTVEGKLNHDGKDIELRRTYKEKWVKKKGELNAELSGHTTVYHINNVPMQQKEYNDRVKELIPEDVFRLITSPTEFVGKHWKDQRDILFRIAGVEEDELLNKEQHRELKDLSQGKAITDYRRELAAAIKKLKDEMLLIPARIDEVSENMPEEQDLSYLEEEATLLETEIRDIDDHLADLSEAHKEQHEQRGILYKQISELKKQRQDIEYKHDAEKVKLQREQSGAIQEREDTLKELSAKTAKIEDYLPKLKVKISEITGDIAHLRARWHEVNKEQLSFDGEDFKCPTCLRPFEKEDIDKKVAEATENFNKDKVKRLAAIQEEGKDKKGELGELEKVLKEMQIDLEHSKNTAIKLNREIEQGVKKRAEVNVPMPQEYHKLSEKIESLERQAEAHVEDKNVTELKESKDEKMQTLKLLQRQLAEREQYDNALGRIEFLKERQRDYSAQLAEQERRQYLSEVFIREKVDLVEGRVNGLFQFVKWKLFDVQLNGAIVETCTATMDGVPFAALNSAGQIKAGLDIINTICDYYSVRAPVWIDNRESVTEIPDTDSQVINLVVDKEYNELKQIL